MEHELVYFIVNRYMVYCSSCRIINHLSCLITVIGLIMCMCVQVASQLIDVDGTAAMPMSGGGAVIGSTPRGAQVRAEGCCLAKGSV